MKALLASPAAAIVLLNLLTASPSRAQESSGADAFRIPWRVPLAQPSVRMTPLRDDFSAARRAWVRSTFPVAAASALDIASSFGGRELNPLLAGRSRMFDARSAAIKTGLVGALLGIEYLVVRRNPRHSRALARLNWVVAGATTGIAVRNFAVR